MKQIDIAALRHPSSDKAPDFAETKSYAIVVDMTRCMENLRIAQERFIKKQLELSHLL